MRFVFLGSFLLGLILAVSYMLVGIERSEATTLLAELRRAAARRVGMVAQDASALRMVFSVAGAFSLLFGVVGYALLRSTILGPGTVALIALAAGAAGAFAASILIAKWAIPGGLAEEVDERYVLQGHVAVVTRAISGGGEGEVAFDIDGVHHVARACSLDGTPVEGNTEVVIERIEDGVAYVEPWAHVEQRI